MDPKGEVAVIEDGVELIHESRDAKLKDRLEDLAFFSERWFQFSGRRHPGELIDGKCRFQYADWYVVPVYARREDNIEQTFWYLYRLCNLCGTWKMTEGSSFFQNLSDFKDLAEKYERALCPNYRCVKKRKKSQ